MIRPSDPPGTLLAMIPGEGGSGRQGPKGADVRGSSNVMGYEDAKQIKEVLSGV